MLIVHYHNTTGHISAWGTADSQVSHLPDHEIARFDEGTVDARTHRVDIATGRLVEKTAAEIAQDNAPSLFEVESIVRGALAASDEFIMPDRTVPDRDAWIAYRQALRGLSNQPDVGAMIDVWPSRPDGIDPIPGLRTRLAAARAAIEVTA
jgi:hypothetical protein